MTPHARRRQNLLWTIRQWMRSAGFLVMLIAFSGICLAAETKSAEVPGGALGTLGAKKVKSAVLDSAKKEAKKPAFKLPDPDPEDVKTQGETVQVQGEVVARNNLGMAVEYDFDPVEGAVKEIWLVFHSKVKVSGVKSLLDLREGDIVKVSYKVTKDKKKIFLESVSFLRKKPKEEPPPAEEEEK